MADAASKRFDDTEKLARLRLARSENIGPVTYRQLLAHYGSAETALDAVPELAQRGGRRRALKVCRRADGLEEIERVAGMNAAHFFWGESAYPDALAALEDAPPVLTVIGRISLLSERSVAIVGARNASINGRKIATQIATDLSEFGLAIISGLARGIDAAAHAASVERGTVAVLAGGDDVIYPKENTVLYEKICAGGTVISEMPPGTEPRGPLFPRRNRIISGLSSGVVVIEAAMRSGSLITARLAGEQGRDVFVVPGSPLDPRSRGANNLIRQGATLVESAADILEDLVAMPRSALAEPEDAGFAAQPGDVSDRGLIHARDAIVDALGPSPVSVDEIVRSLALPVGTVRSIFLELELAGRLERQPGNVVTLISA